MIHAQLWMPCAAGPVPAVIEGLSPKATALLFEALARSLSNRMRHVVLKLSLLAQRVKAKLCLLVVVFAVWIYVLEILPSEHGSCKIEYAFACSLD
jgi:hypothetical protein